MALATLLLAVEELRARRHVCWRARVRVGAGAIRRRLSQRGGAYGPDGSLLRLVARELARDRSEFPGLFPEVRTDCSVGRAPPVFPRSAGGDENAAFLPARPLDAGRSLLIDGAGKGLYKNGFGVILEDSEGSFVIQGVLEGEIYVEHDDRRCAVGRRRQG